MDQTKIGKVCIDKKIGKSAWIKKQGKMCMDQIKRGKECMDQKN